MKSWLLPDGFIGDDPSSKHNARWLAVFLAILVAAYCIIGLHFAWGATGLIGVLESRFGGPGTPHVLPECGCTVRYVGTRVDGMDYYVHFKKLD
jgi:hypothetical protein